MNVLKKIISAFSVAVMIQPVCCSYNTFAAAATSYANTCYGMINALEGITVADSFSTEL